MRINLGIIVALSVALTACGPTHVDSPGTKVVFQRVEVPVQQPCPVTKPVRPGPLARPLPVDPARLVDLLAAKLQEWAGVGGYGERADAAIATCLKAHSP
jgi:hypothetical protein